MTVDELLVRAEQELAELRQTFYREGRYRGRERIDRLARLIGGIRQVVAAGEPAVLKNGAIRSARSDGQRHAQRAR